MKYLLESWGITPTMELGDGRLQLSEYIWYWVLGSGLLFLGRSQIATARFLAGHERWLTAACGVLVIPAFDLSSSMCGLYLARKEAAVHK